MALNASTGHLLWTFNSVVGAGAGVQALGLGSGGAWETPLVGSDGSVAVFGNTVLIPAGGPKTSKSGGGNPQLVTYTVP